MGKRKTRRTRKRTRKRGGSTRPDYIQVLGERKQTLQHSNDLLETELEGKEYITKSLKNQLLDVVRASSTLGQIRIPLEIRRADPEYMELFRRSEELFGILMSMKVVE